MRQQPRKLLLRVLRDGNFEYVHFCYVSKDLSDLFFTATGKKPADLGVYLSLWATEDFGVRLPLLTYEDVTTLKGIIESRFQMEYAELYELSSGENPSVSGLVRLWVSRHMRVTIVEQNLGRMKTHE